MDRTFDGDVRHVVVCVVLDPVGGMSEPPAEDGPQGRAAGAALGREAQRRGAGTASLEGRRATEELVLAARHVLACMGLEMSKLFSYRKIIIYIPKFKIQEWIMILRLSHLSMLPARPLERA